MQAGHHDVTAELGEPHVHVHSPFSFGGVIHLLRRHVALTVALAVGAFTLVVSASRVFKRGAVASPKTTLKATETTPLLLASKTEVSHNVRIFRFALPSPDHVLGLPTGKHVAVSAEINGKRVTRSYTPISCDEDKGFVDILVKVYRRGEHPQFPDGGAMSQHLDSLRVGVDTLDFRGPTGRSEYRGRGRLFMKGAEREVTHLNLIAGGTGITPVLQVLRHVLRDASDATRVSLVFANSTIDDVLLRQELEECAADPRVSVWFTVSRVPEDPAAWPYGVGRITPEALANRIAPASPTTVNMLCGPAPMVNQACKPALEALGHDASSVLVF